MIKFTHLLAAAALSVAPVISTSSAMSTVMDFDALPSSPLGLLYAGVSITQNGYMVTDTTAELETSDVQFLAAASGWPNGRGTDNGTTTLGLQSASSSTPVTFDLTSQSSTPFDLISIEIGSLDANNQQFYNSIATKWTFVGNLFGGGIVSETITTDPKQMSTYLLDPIFQDLRSVIITAQLSVMGIVISNGGSVTADFDDIVVKQFGGAVPESAAWALMISGFGLTGIAAGRRCLHVVLA